MVTAARGSVIALTLVFLAPVALASEQETFYLGPDGFPQGSLVTNPRGGEMPNYDPGRDIEPGLFLERSGLGLAESEDTKYQHWQTEMSGQSIIGYPSLVIWSAPERFNAGKRGVLSVYLVDCDAIGADCLELGASEVTIAIGRGAAWVDSELDFDPIDHRFGSGRYLGVRVVVPESSESDMMLAYGYPKQRSRLTISTEPPSSPVETVATSSDLRLDASEIAIDKMSRLSLVVSESVARSDDAAPTWNWAVSLALSTLMLVVLGAFLVSRLTKLGRHERRFMADNSESRRTERITVSTR